MISSQKIEILENARMCFDSAGAVVILAETDDCDALRINRDDVAACNQKFWS